MKQNIILLIEDDLDHADLIISAFNDEEAGSVDKDVFLLRNGQDAIDYFCKNDFPENTCQVGFNSDAQESFRIERILLDITLPKVNRMDILKYIRKRSGYCATPVTILSTDSNKETFDEAYRQGANSFIEKLVSYKTLVENKNSFTKSYALP